MVAGGPWMTRAYCDEPLRRRRVHGASSVAYVAVAPSVCVRLTLLRCCSTGDSVTNAIASFTTMLRTSSAKREPRFVTSSPMPSARLRSGTSAGLGAMRTAPIWKPRTSSLRYGARKPPPLDARTTTFGERS